MPYPEDDRLEEEAVSSERRLSHVGAHGRYVAVGDLISGKYLVEGVLGSGGMAFVVAARHIDLDQTFALKFLNAEFIGNKAIVARFMREAKAACKIRNEHVAHVHDVGFHDGAPFLVMEHLVGDDLATVLARQGPLPIQTAVEYAIQACDALAAAHAFGFVHRDVKPENLFLLDRAGPPTIKLLDFGISKAVVVDEGVSKLTGRLTLGTPRYMSPEQIRSTTMADHGSDLWSLGAVLYELLTGSVAFPGESVPELCAAVLELEPTPVRDLRPDVPVALCDVVSKCLEKEPANRWANVAELAQALLPFAPSRSVVSAERSSSCMRVGSAAPPPEFQEGAVSSVAGLSVEVRTPPATLTLPVALGARAPKRATRPWRGVAIVALAMIGVGAMTFYGSRRMATTAAPAIAPPPAETPFRSAPATAVQIAERPAARAVVEATPVTSAKTQGAGVHVERAPWVASQAPRGQAAAKRGAAAPNPSAHGPSVGNAAGSTSVTTPPSEASSERPRVELGY